VLGKYGITRKNKAKYARKFPVEIQNKKYIASPEDPE
jgi:hypothetical protein